MVIGVLRVAGDDAEGGPVMRARGPGIRWVRGGAADEQRWGRKGVWRVRRKIDVGQRYEVDSVVRS